MTASHQDIPERVDDILENVYALGVVAADPHSKMKIDAPIHSKSEGRSAILALIREVAEGVIGEHLPGCPAITHYVGPEGTPYDGPHCDCGVLEAQGRLDALLGGKQAD
jgi:hypothetical protein